MRRYERGELVHHLAHGTDVFVVGDCTHDYEWPVPKRYNLVSRDGTRRLESVPDYLVEPVNAHSGG